MNYATKSMLETGFLTRFMNFSANEDTDINLNYMDTIDVTDIARECARIFPFYPIDAVDQSGQIIKDLGSIEPRREPLTITNLVKIHRNNLDKSFYEKERSLYKEDKLIEAALYTRQFEMLERLAITNAVSCDRREILIEDYDYALKVVTACLERSKKYYSVIGGEDKLDRDVMRVLEKLKSKGKATQRDLGRSLHFDKKRMDAAIATLIEYGYIAKISQSDASGRVEYAAAVTVTPAVTR